MLESIDEGLWVADSGKPGASVCVSFGVHGNERPPIDAGLALVEAFETGALALRAGKLLLSHSNPRASAIDARWSEGGVDLNRCFHADTLARDAVVYEEQRARDIVAALERVEAEVLVDFHCTVEPGERFLMQHPPVANEAHARVFSLLRARFLLADPNLNFGSVSLDEWMSTRGRVGICYETGWIQDPENTASAVLAEMKNVLRGTGLIDGDATIHSDKELLQLEHVVRCAGDGFVWTEGVGQNLQALPAGQVLGAYASGEEVVLDADSVLIFPKKKPELVELGKPLVYIAIARG